MIRIDEIKRSPAHGHACGYGYCNGTGGESLLATSNHIALIYSVISVAIA